MTQGNELTVPTGARNGGEPPNAPDDHIHQNEIPLGNVSGDGIPSISEGGIQPVLGVGNRCSEIQQLRFEIQQLRVQNQQLRVQNQQLEATKETENKILVNLLARNNRQMRDQDDEMKAKQSENNYLKESVKVLQLQLDENKGPIADTASDDGSDGIFVHRSKGELEVKIDELETQVQEVQRERDHYQSEVLQFEIKLKDREEEINEQKYQCQVYQVEIKQLREAWEDAMRRRQEAEWLLEQRGRR